MPPMPMPIKNSRVARTSRQLALLAYPGHLAWNGGALGAGLLMVRVPSREEPRRRWRRTTSLPHSRGVRAGSSSGMPEQVRAGSVAGRLDTEGRGTSR